MSHVMWLDKIKMGIKVAVLEKDFASLSELGLPVSLCLHLQEKNLVLREALWNAKATRTGFSISLFWPADPPRPQPVFSKTKKRRPRRRCRKRKHVSIQTEQQKNKDSTHSEEPNNCSNTTAKKTLVPTDSHASASATSDKTSVADNHSEPSSEESIDLATLTDAKYQSVEGVHGITYRNFSTGKYDWTPVVRRRRRRKHHRASNTPSKPSSSSDPDSDSVLDSLNPADPKVLRIVFACDGRTPGLSVTKSNGLCKTRSWTPIAARTRSKEFK